MKRLLLLGILVLVLFVVWDIRLATHKMPHRTTLTDKSGSTIEVEILTATPDTVRFALLHNNKQYTWETDRLNLVSRYKVLRLVQSSTRADAAKTAAPPSPE